MYASQFLFRLKFKSNIINWVKNLSIFTVWLIVVHRPIVFSVICNFILSNHNYIVRHFENQVREWEWEGMVINILLPKGM